MMQQELIFLPMLAQVLLTAVVFFSMYTARVREMRRKKIHPQAIATAHQSGKLLTDSGNIADNFSNQFEMPVLFYVLLISLYVTQLVNPVMLALACLFVLLRAIHSLIHCTYNKVMHRFKAYAASSFVLWTMWILFAARLLFA